MNSWINELKNMSQKILAVALLFLTSYTFAQKLEAVLCDTRLPVPVFHMPIVYDGMDSIYVLGGDGLNGLQQDILKFSVTTETLEKVGTMDPIVYGSAVWAGNENILYFGGYNGSQWQPKVWSYKPDGASDDWTQVGDLPRSAGYTSGVWDREEYTYVFGGYTGTGPYYLNTISRYSRVTNTSVVVGELPGPRFATSAVWDEATGDAYVFGGFLFLDEEIRDIVKFNPAKNTVTKLNVTLPDATYYSCAVWTGTEVYIIGGKSIEVDVANIARFNPSTNEVLIDHVDNLPASLYRHDCVFVEKLNRIYVFGGLSGDSRRDEIMYIDLGPSPTSPTTTTSPITTTTTKIPTTTTKRPGNPVDCNNEVDGTRFPDPYCCKTFYQCQNQEAILRQCPSQLHFNPSHDECDLPEIVKCRAVYE